MMFGDYGKMMKAVEVAQKVVDTEPIISNKPVNRVYNRALAEAAGKSPVVESDSDDGLDSLLADVTKALTECSNDIQKPTPPVAQKDFVKNAVSKQKTASSTKKPELKTQPKAGLAKMEASDDLKVKGDAFKKYILENFSSSDKALVEAVTNVFDIMVLGKLK